MIRTLALAIILAISGSASADGTGKGELWGAWGGGKDGGLFLYHNPHGKSRLWTRISGHNTGFLVDVKCWEPGSKAEMKIYEMDGMAERPIPAAKEGCLIRNARMWFLGTSDGKSFGGFWIVRGELWCGNSHMGTARLDLTGSWNRKSHRWD